MRGERLQGNEAMKLNDLLREKKESIAASWLERTLKTFPKDSFNFLSEQKDRFANPIGHALTIGTRGIVEVLSEGRDISEAQPHLAEIIKIRCIQETPASEAVSFILLLGEVVREATAKEPEASIAAEMKELDDRIQEILLLAFDEYVSCREKIFKIRVDEVKINVLNHLRRTGFFANDEDREAEQQPGGPDRQHPLTRGGDR
jgi:hypothetical protein